MVPSKTEDGTDSGTNQYLSLLTQAALYACQLPRSRRSSASKGSLRPPDSPLHRPSGRSDPGPEMVCPALATGSHLSGGAPPLGYGDPAPMVRPGHRPYHARPAGPLLLEHPGRPLVAKTTLHGPAHRGLVRQTVADFRGCHRPWCVGTCGWRRRVFHCPQSARIGRNSPSLCTTDLSIRLLTPLEIRKVQLWFGAEPEHLSELSAPAGVCAEAAQEAVAQGGPSAAGSLRGGVRRVGSVGSTNWGQGILC